MKILITGNLGYVGPGVVKEFRKYHPDAYLIGYFAKYLTTNAISPDTYLNVQHDGDVRNFPQHLPWRSYSGSYP